MFNVRFVMYKKGGYWYCADCYGLQVACAAERSEVEPPAEFWTCHVNGDTYFYTAK